MKTKIAFFISLIFIVQTGFAAAQSVAGTIGLMSASQNLYLIAATRVLIAGGYDNGAGGDGGKKQKSGGSSLDELRESVDSAPGSTDGASPPVVGEMTISSGESQYLPDDFFRESHNGAEGAYKNLLETAGYIDSSFEGYGQVVDGETSQQIFFGTHEDVYIDKGKADGLKPGDKFWVMHKSPDVIKHPKTRNAIGAKVIIDGIIEVVELAEKTSRATVFRAYDGIRRGFKIVPYEDTKAPFVDPDKPISEKNIEGYLIASKYENKGFGAGDVVYLDVGESSGVEPGDVFDIIDQEPVILADGSIEKGLPKVKGQATVLSTRDATSTALIYVSKTVMVVGDKIKFAQVRRP